MIVYHSLLVGLLVRDALALPTRRGWEATRDIPNPLSLGAGQEILVGIRNRRAAGLQSLLADHAPLSLRPSAREVRGSFDARGEWIAAYAVEPPHRGSFQFGPIDLRTWRPHGWWARQVYCRSAYRRVACWPAAMAASRDVSPASHEAISRTPLPTSRTCPRVFARRWNDHAQDAGADGKDARGRPRGGGDA